MTLTVNTGRMNCNNMNNNNRKKISIMKAYNFYQSPEIAMICVSTETGFAASETDSYTVFSIQKMEEGGEF